MNVWKSGLLSAIVVILSGCLVTRQQVRESGKKPTPEQQERTSAQMRYQELEEQMRFLNGKVETLENGLNNLTVERSSSLDKEDREKKNLQERLKIYEETLEKMESQYLLLAQKVEALKEQRASETVATSSGAKKTSFQAAEDEFNKKNWKQAIVAYEKYRELNPGGKSYAEATYKIGVSFQELGMKMEAKVFFSEVVEKFPKSEFAKKSNFRMKSAK